jgi:hypothetical protein
MRDGEAAVQHRAGRAYDEAMSRLRFLILPTILLVFAAAQVPRGPSPEAMGTKPNNDRHKKELIAQESYKESLDDTKKLIATAEELKAELEKNDRYVVSMAAIRKTEEIEKLAKRIRGRLKE